MEGADDAVLEVLVLVVDCEGGGGAAGEDEEEVEVSELAGALVDDGVFVI